MKISHFVGIGHSHFVYIIPGYLQHKEIKHFIVKCFIYAGDSLELCTQSINHQYKYARIYIVKILKSFIVHPNTF